MNKKVAVVITGCGNRDGAEITEAVSSLIALSKYGASYECFAPDITVTSVNYLTNETAEKRNTLIESARICRGKVKNLNTLDPNKFDALVFPGGAGAAMHLSDWGQKGAKCTVLPEAEKIIKEFHRQSKPIGAICIAPTLIARVLGAKGVTVTVGQDLETAQEINKTGDHHENCPVDDFVSDRENKVITTPAYMYGDAQPHQVYKGVAGLIKELVEMA